jgi:hypothetical protein
MSDTIPVLKWKGWRAQVPGGLLEVHLFSDERRYELWFNHEVVRSGMRSAQGAMTYARIWMGDDE